MPLEIIDEIRQRKDERGFLRKVIAVLGFVCLIVLVGVATNAHAAPMAQTVTAEGARIVVTDEACQLKEVTNLKYRAVWHEKGKTFEGCYAVHPYGLVVAYFDDKTVAVMPLDAFVKVTGA